MSARTIWRLFALAVVTMVVLPMPAHATFEGQNGKIAYSRHGDIFLIDPDGTDRVRLTEGKANDFSPAFSPDGSRVAFVRAHPMTEKQNVFVAAVDGSSIGRVTRNLRGYAQPPVWSPDGALLAFEDVVVRPGGMGGALCVVHPDSLPVTRLTGYRHRHAYPSWSPDSERLVFGQHGIVVVDADGTTRLRLTSGESLDQDPQWSPSGDRILFSRTIPGSPETGDQGAAVVSIAPDGTGESVLTDGVLFDHGTRWSPDGTLIAFLEFDPMAGGSDVWVMDADGSDQRSVTTGRIAGQNLAWSPDGTRLAFDDWNDVLTVDPMTQETTFVTSSPKTPEFFGDWQMLPG